MDNHAINQIKYFNRLTALLSTQQLFLSAVNGEEDYHFLLRNFTFILHTLSEFPTSVEIWPLPISS